MNIVGSRTLSPDDLESCSLLEACRGDGTAESDLPQPVWVKEKPSGPPVTLWSPRTISSSVRESLVVDVEDRPEWLVTLELWNRYGGPDPVEKGRVLRFLQDRLKESPRERSRCLDLLGLPNSTDVLDAYRSLTQLPDSLRTSVSQGDLSPRLFRYLQRVPDPLQQPIIDLLEESPRLLSVQEMRQTAEALRRVPREKYDQFCEWVNSLQTSGDEPQGEDLIEGAKKLAYPEVTRREESFREDLEALDIDGRIEVTPPDNFEGDYLDFSFRCTRDDDLDYLADEVKRCRKLLQHV